MDNPLRAAKSNPAADEDGRAYLHTGLEPHVDEPTPSGSVECGEEVRLHGSAANADGCGKEEPMGRPASIAPGSDQRHASYTHIVLHATPLPVAITGGERQSSLSTGDGIAVASAIIAIVATIFAWRAVSLAKRSLQESQRATLATLAAAKITQEEAEYLRSERSRRPDLIAHFQFEPVAIHLDVSHWSESWKKEKSRSSASPRAAKFRLAMPPRSR